MVRPHLVRIENHERENTALIYLMHLPDRLKSTQLIFMIETAKKLFMHRVIYLHFEK